MASTSELSSPSSVSSSSDEPPSFSPLPTSTFPLGIPHCLSRMPLDLDTDAPSMENLSYEYTQRPIYPDLLDTYLKKTVTISWAQSIAADSDVAKPLRTTCMHRSGRSESQPRPLDRKFNRTSHPSFVKIPETLLLNKAQLHGLRSPHPRCITSTMGTDALISIAWTGEISSPVVASGYAPSRVGATYMWPKLRISDIEVSPTQRASWPGNSYGNDSQQSPHYSPIDISSESERWTLANAISDDRVTDEKLVELLEDFRSRRLRSTERSIFRFLPDALSPSEEALHTDAKPPDETHISPRSPVTIPADIAGAWSTTRRAVLVCRELIRTERHYLSSLSVLLAKETRPPPPPLMLSRLPALVDASSRLVDLMEANPSVMGVCAAFIDTFEQLEEAFTQWCEVVGQFFSNSVGSPDTLVKRSNSAPAASLSVVERTRTNLSAKAWSKKSKTINLDEIVSMVARNPRSKSQLKPQVRDLAILPTQRIVRYVLLFKDLLVFSPPLNVKPIIERATEAAVTIAEKSDKAQDHVAFRMTPSTT